jgi:hypothetical protein
MPIFAYLGRTWIEKVGIFLGHWVFYYHFGTFYGYLVFLWPCWYIFYILVGMLCQEKSGNPATDRL